MIYILFCICFLLYGISSFAYDYGVGIIRYENGVFFKYAGKPDPENIILYRPIVFVSGIGATIYEALTLISIISVVIMFLIGFWKLEWYIPLIGLTTLYPFGKFLGKIIIKSAIGGIASPLSNLIVVTLTTIFLIKIFA